MNAIFTVVFIISTLLICFVKPENFLSCLLTGAENSLKTAFTLFCVYAVWMGLSAVAEDCGLNKKLSRLFVPVCRKFFKTENQTAARDVSMNLTCNLIGIGGAATPFAVKAVNELEKDKNYFAQNLLFIVNATSIQLIPTTVIALRAAAGSASPNDIVLPSFLASFISTALAVALFLIFTKLKNRTKAVKKEVKGAWL